MQTPAESWHVFSRATCQPFAKAGRCHRRLPEPLDALYPFAGHINADLGQPKINLKSECRNLRWLGASDWNIWFWPAAIRVRYQFVRKAGDGQPHPKQSLRAPSASTLTPERICAETGGWWPLTVAAATRRQSDRK